MKTQFKKKRKKTGGRQKGTKNKSTILFQNLLSEDKAELVRKAVNLALEGNVAVINKLLDKILPNAQPKPIIPPIEKDLVPDFANWTDEQLDEYIKANTGKKEKSK